MTKQENPTIILHNRILKFMSKLAALTITCRDWINPVQQSKYHGCWCPGSLRPQVISTHDIDYVE